MSIEYYECLGTDHIAPGANSKFEIKLCYGLEVNRAQSETL